MFAILLVSLILVGAPANGDNATETTPVMANDGKDNFLILSEDEVRANPTLLAYLSAAGRDDVEDMVGNHPQFQEKIFDRIKAAVEARERRKHVVELTPAAPAAPAALTGANMEAGRDVPLGMPVETDTQASGDDDDEDDDDDDVVDKLKIAKIKADVKKSALKIFKIGKSLRGKLKQYLRRPQGRDKKKSSNKKKKTSSPAWPSIRYQVSTGYRDPNGKTV